MRLSAWTATATLVARRSSVCVRNSSPITCFHGGFDPCSPVVSRRVLPRHAPVLGDALQVTVPLRGCGLGRVARHRGRTGRDNQRSHNLAKLLFDLSVRFPRERFRPGCGEGFSDAPVVICFRSGESRSGFGGADDPAQREGFGSDGSGEP